METRFPDLSLRGFFTEACVLCRKVNSCLKFLCNHSYCDECLYQYYGAKIQNILYVLNNKPDSLNGFGSFLGCPSNCNES